MNDEQLTILGEWGTGFKKKYGGLNDPRTKCGEFDYWDTMYLKSSQLDEFIKDLHFPIEIAKGNGVAVDIKAELYAMQPREFATIKLRLDTGEIVAEYAKF